MFRQTFGCLHYQDSLILQDLHSKLVNLNKHVGNVCHLSRSPKWSGLCELLRCLSRADSITQDRYFRNSCSFGDCGDAADGGAQTVCNVNENAVIHGSRYLWATLKNKQQICLNSVRN